MRRIPVAVTPQEDSAINWLQHFAREDQLPPKFRPLRKKAAHIIIKSLSLSDFAALIACHDAQNSEPALTPTP